MKNKKVWILAMVIIVLLVMISYTGERDGVTLVEDYFIAIIIPVQNFFSGLGQSVQSVFHAVLSHQEIKAENLRLKEEFAMYQERVLIIEDLKLENERLKELLEFRKRSEQKMVAAKVIGRDPSRWFNTVTLNRGSADGIEKEMVVVSHQGLVGMVSSISMNASEVILLTDPRMAVSTMVQRSRDPGVSGILESHPDDYYRLKFTNLLPDADVQEGDIIVTSGLGGIYPSNIMVGRVETVGLDEHDLVKTAIIRPAVELSKLEEVLIVVSY